MTQDRDFKKIVRRRMIKTGESFTGARAALRVPRSSPAPNTPPGDCGAHAYALGSSAAKKILRLAEDEAKRSFAAHVGTEHLLIGILREGEGTAAMTLQALGVALPKVRLGIEANLERPVRFVAQELAPSRALENVLGTAIEQAALARSKHLGSEHLLLGILIEDQDLGARLLQDLGVTLESVREMVEHSSPGPSSQLA